MPDQAEEPGPVPGPGSARVADPEPDPKPPGSRPRTRPETAREPARPAQQAKWVLADGLQSSSGLGFCVTDSTGDHLLETICQRPFALDHLSETTHRRPSASDQPGGLGPGPRGGLHVEERSHGERTQRTWNIFTALSSRRIAAVVTALALIPVVPAYALEPAALPESTRPYLYLETFDGVPNPAHFTHTLLGVLALLRRRRLLPPAADAGVPA